MTRKWRAAMTPNERKEWGEYCLREMQEERRHRAALGLDRDQGYTTSDTKLLNRLLGRVLTVQGVEVALTGAYKQPHAGSALVRVTSPCIDGGARE